MEDVRARAKPRHAARDLRRRSRDPVQKGQSRSGLGKPARDHGQAEAHGERGKDAHLQNAGGRVRFPGIQCAAETWKGVLHERLKSCLKAAQMMRAGPSGSAFRSGSQTTPSCCVQKAWW